VVGCPLFESVLESIGHDFKKILECRVQVMKLVFAAIGQYGQVWTTKTRMWTALASGAKAFLLASERPDSPLEKSTMSYKRVENS
jgi:hypothetical protein